MTATSKISATDNGWNAVIKALEECKDDDARIVRAKELLKNADEVQKKYNSDNAIFHYAEGVREAIIEFETTKAIPSEA
jgi:hypothetical protein